MKKTLASLMVGMAVSAGASAAPLTSWTFDIDGAGARTPYAVSYDITGTSSGLIQFAATGASTFSWQEWGFINFTGVQGGKTFGACDETGCLGNEFTGIYHLSGTGTFGGAADVSTGTISLFVEGLSLANQYSSTAGFFGANNGTNIANVNITSGSIDPVEDAAIPVPTSNAKLVVGGSPASMQTGYFADDYYGDLATHWSTGGIVLGFVTGNASSNINPESTMVSELLEYACSSSSDPVACAAGFIFENTLDAKGNPVLANSFIVSSGAQLKFDVPEPATVALLGLGLLGAGVVRRRKVVAN